MPRAVKTAALLLALKLLFALRFLKASREVKSVLGLLGVFFLGASSIFTP